MRIIPVFLVLSSFLLSGCTETIDERSFCKDTETGNELSIAEAELIAMSSDCAEEGPIKDEATCNKDTGTVWFDIMTTKEGCDPACVVDINDKTASINWRCTGVI